MTMHDRIFHGKLFTDMCEGLTEERMQAKRYMKAYNDTAPDEFDKRMELCKAMLGKGAQVLIEPPFFFCYGTHIELGEGTYINMNCTFTDDGMIVVGKNVLFGPAVNIATVGHPIRPDMREYMYTDSVTIGDNAWIGENVTICPGVTIGENSVIGAGSVVTKDIPANVIAVGNPCRVLREIDRRDMEYYYKDRKIDPEDLARERELRRSLPEMP